MTYTPNADDATQPVDAVIAETAQAEFRALKSKINTMVGLSTSGQSLPALYIIVAANLATALAATAAVAATITALTALINTKAPLFSPVFAGNPQAPTPAPGDNSISLATTAFVTGAIAAAVFAPLALTQYINTSITLANGITYLVDTSGGSITLTLPIPSTLNRAIMLTDASGSWYTNNVTLAGGGNNIGTPDTGQAASVLLNIADQSLTIYWNGTYWRFI